jgi:hypothetical protein
MNTKEAWDRLYTMIRGHWNGDFDGAANDLVIMNIAAYAAACVAEALADPLALLERLAREDEDGVDYIGLRIVYSRVLGGYSYSKTRCGDSTRAEALVLLKGAKDAGES